MRPVTSLVILWPIISTIQSDLLFELDQKFRSLQPLRCSFCSDTQMLLFFWHICNWNYAFFWASPVYLAHFLYTEHSFGPVVISESTYGQVCLLFSEGRQQKLLWWFVTSSYVSYCVPYLFLLTVELTDLASHIIPTWQKTCCNSPSSKALIYWCFF